MAPKKEKTSKKDISELSFAEVTKLLKSMSKDVFSLTGEKEISEFCTTPKIRTNLPIFDYLLGGGITRGRVTCIAGEESAGKTTETLEIIAVLVADLKARGSFKRVLWNDIEGAWDSKRAKQLGVDEEYLHIVREKVIEDFFKLADTMMTAGVIEAMVVDSLDNMIARKVEDNAYQATMGGTAGTLGQHLPNLFGKIIENDVTCIFIKQAREKIGGYNPTGNPILIINGGRTFKHDCDTILILSRLSNKDKDYTPVKIKAMKTRSPRLGMTYPFSLAGNGCDKVRDICTLAVEHGIVVVGGGGWTSYGDTRVHGLDNFIAELRADKDLLKKLWDQVYEEVIDADGCLIVTDEEADQTIIED
jgi:RecA/RadA recombinase